ncbi:hypothetical protein CDV55_107078 [Aspergillus turcosus]|uniref:Raptor N-terminal CASPase-like domain-containing protein n=1 Tax=Aspergillus turcosus TaxID=1245748 RepID=A0A229XGD2_9EURO|nr:hypothetical protein CDV55_107078 [Aspergillus turcosus]RLL96602.1 hypothetical protein CFD26_103121 [Aspergillus turcosus]
MNPIGPSARPDHAYAGPQTRSQWARRIPEFLEDLRGAFENTSTFHLYSQVAVIAMHWENDDINVLPLETELLQILRDDYGFSTSSYTIPTTNCPNPQTRLLQHLLAWTTQHSGENTLRMYIYSGHAGNTGHQSIQWHLAGAVNQYGRLAGPSINWWDIRGNLEVDPGSVCYIFDCCSAASGVLKDYAGAEFVAAAAWEQPASSSQNFCFTRAFIDALKRLKGQNSTLADVYATIVRRAKESQIEANEARWSVPAQGLTQCEHQ